MSLFELGWMPLLSVIAAIALIPDIADACRHWRRPKDNS